MAACDGRTCSGSSATPTARAARRATRPRAAARPRRPARPTPRVRRRRSRRHRRPALDEAGPAPLAQRLAVPAQSDIELPLATRRRSARRRRRAPRADDRARHRGPGPVVERVARSAARRATARARIAHLPAGTILVARRGGAASQRTSASDGSAQARVVKASAAAFRARSSRQRCRTPMRDEPRPPSALEDREPLRARPARAAASAPARGAAARRARGPRARRASGR